MLSVNNITIRFGGLTAVSNFSLKIGEKEVIGLIKISSVYSVL